MSLISWAYVNWDLLYGPKESPGAERARCLFYGRAIAIRAFSI
jgi:hypothetical protein